MTWLSHLFKHVEHLDGGLDGRTGLVGIKTACAEGLAVERPCYDCLHESVGATARWYRHIVAGKDREGPAECVFVDVAHSTHESVILSVAGGMRP